MLTVQCERDGGRIMSAAGRACRTLQVVENWSSVVRGSRGGNSSPSSRVKWAGATLLHCCFFPIMSLSVKLPCTIAAPIYK
jgi:hypothetical protein